MSVKQRFWDYLYRLRIKTRRGAHAPPAMIFSSGETCFSLALQERLVRKAPTPQAVDSPPLSGAGVLKK